jgi:hypothetical protein
VAGYRVIFVVLPLGYLKLKLNLNCAMQRHRTKHACRLDLRNLSMIHPGQPSYSPSSMALQSSADLCLLSGLLSVSSLCSNRRCTAYTVVLCTSPTKTRQGIKSRFSRTESLLLTEIRSHILEYCYSHQQWRS